MCFGGREDVEAKRSREIDALIHRDEKVMQKVVKLLLLGKPFPAGVARQQRKMANQDGVQALARVENRRF